MSYTLRPAEDPDWPEVRRVAGEAAPWTGDANDGWLALRRTFGGVRRHYVAMDAGRRIAGYGAVEQDAGEDARYRMFVVAGPEPLDGGAGDALFERLLDDLRALRATSVWMREEARDAVLIGFATERGFAERSRFEHDGMQIVVLEMSIDHPAEP